MQEDSTNHFENAPGPLRMRLIKLALRLRFMPSITVVTVPDGYGYSKRIKYRIYNAYNTEKNGCYILQVQPKRAELIKLIEHVTSKVSTYVLSPGTSHSLECSLKSCLGKIEFPPD